MAADIDKVKRNIQKMIDQGAPDADIDAYLGDEGVTTEQLNVTVPQTRAEKIGAAFGRAGQSLDDSMRIIVDTATRGYFDKMLGEEEQAKTQASRERQGWGALPIDMGTAVATSPYRIGSAVVGGGFGALEGAASTYGHQKNWIPDLQGAEDIAVGAGKGAALGGLGAKAGEWLGKGWSALTGSKVPVQAPQGGSRYPRAIAAMDAASHIAKGGDNPLAQGGMAIATHGYGPAASAILKQGAGVLSSLPPKTTMLDPHVSEAARDAFAKMLMGYGNAP